MIFVILSLSRDLMTMSASRAQSPQRRVLTLPRTHGTVGTIPYRGSREICETTHRTFPTKLSWDGRTPFGAQAPVPFKTPHFPLAVPPSGLVLSNKKDGIVKTVPLCTILIFHYDCDCSGGFCGCSGCSGCEADCCGYCCGGYGCSGYA